jgi:hypothetical protein
MTKIQRYEMNHKGLPEPDDNGVWVFRKEHDAIVAALKEQVQKLEAEAEREDEITIDALASMREWKLRADTAEAELSRRDAAAGEPFGYVHQCDHFFTMDSGTIYKTPGGNYTRPLFPAAQPSALPPEMVNSDAPDHYSSDQAFAWTAGANWMREQAKALGCKAIKLPKVNHPAQFDYADRLTEALKAQGFTVEGE